MNPYDDRQLTRLKAAMDWSSKRLEHSRAAFKNAVNQYVGMHYAADGNDAEVAVNLLELFLEICMRHLIASSPRALVTTPYPGLSSTAAKLRLGLNHEIERLKLVTTLRRVVKDALFSIGIVKIGITENGKLTLGEEEIPTGQTYVERVSLDDFICDMSAHCLEEGEFIAQRYRIPWDDFEADKSFENKDDLRPTGDHGTAISAIDSQSEERVSDISQGQSGHGDKEWHERIDLWDVWDPRERLLFTIPHRDRQRVVRVIEYDGPEHGPFLLLAFHANEVPDQIMPLSPIASLIDLHAIGNRLFNKLAIQARDQQDVNIVRASTEAAKTAERLRQAGDQGWVTGDPDHVGVHKSGGIDERTFAFFINIKKLFAYFGGNLDAMGGLGPQADTLGQEQMLTASASKKIAMMQSSVVDFVRDVLEDIAFYLWTNPTLDLRLTRKIPGLGNRSVRLRANNLAGEFLDYNFQIEPHSLQRQAPAQRLQTVLQAVQTVVIPAMAQMAAQGISLDFAALIRLIADYTNTPELIDVLDYAGPTLGSQREPGLPGGGAQGPQKAAATTRTNVRVNRPGATNEGAEDVLMNSLLGRRSQASEAAAAGRAVG